MKISELIKATNAKVIGSFEEDVEVKISTDTRTIQDGDFYLPLKGASFDGEKFIDQAFEKVRRLHRDQNGIYAKMRSLVSRCGGT